jgi:3-dehydroquinate synthase
MKKIFIKLTNKPYTIFVEENITSKIINFHKKNFNNCKAYIITDNNVKNLYFKPLNDNFVKNNITTKAFFIKAGESSKSFKVVESLTRKILADGINRNDVIYALGGGVIGDLCGFLASILLRGVNFIQIPTTLLSQVDSSVGGKTGINNQIGKNLIGSFYQPAAVFIDPLTLTSLPKEEFISGYAEVVKYSLINDNFFFHWLNKNIENTLNFNKSTILKIITTCCQKKAQFVIKDEKEQSTRIFLNLGHTFAHAIESELKYTIKHGAAVSVGLLMAMKLSYLLNLSDKSDYKMLFEHLRSVLLPTNLNELSTKIKWSSNNLIKKMYADKKVYKGNIRFIICQGIGKVLIKSDIEKSMLKETIEGFI